MIRYGLPERLQVHVAIYSLLGQLVTELVDASQSPGLYSVVWNGKDHRGKDMSSGTYLIRLQAGGTQLVKKALLVR